MFECVSFGLKKRISEFLFLSGLTVTRLNHLITASRFIVQRAAALGLFLAAIFLACDSAGGAGFEDMRHVALTAKDGAPAGVYAFAQTPDGFLWVGTASGLYRYDGATFTQPYAGRLNGVSILSLLADPNGDLWIGYVFGDIDRVHAGRVINYPVAQLPGGSIGDFIRAPDGTLWVSCYRGLARFDGQRWATVGKTMGYSGEEPQWMGSSQDKLIVLTDSAAFQLPRGATQFEAIDRLTAREARYGSPPHRPWREAELEVYRDESHYSSMLLDHTGKLWTNDDLRVRRFRWPSGADEPVVEETLLDEAVAAAVMSIFEDREGNVWIGTGTGLEQFSPSKLQRLRAVNIISGRSPLVIPKDDSTLWISGLEIPLTTFDGTRVSLPAMGEYIVTYARAHDGSLWLAGNFGVLHYSRAGVIEKTPALPIDPATLQHHQPWQSIAEDGAGVIWVSVLGHGQFCLKDGVWSAPDPGLGLPTRTAIRLLTDDRRRLWLTYPDNRVAVVEEGHSHMYTAADGLSIGNPTAIAVRGNHVWVGGDMGVAALVKGRFASLHGKSGDPFLTIEGIIETGAGEVWMNGARGVVRISRESAVQFLADSAPVDFELFDWHDGLDGGGPVLRPAPNLLQMPDGRIFLSRMNGVWWVDPSHIPRNRVAPVVEVDRVVRDGDHIRVDYTATSLTNPDRVHFRYRLDGMNETWQEAGSRRQAYYTNLRPGHYTFNVMAANEDGVWSANTATVGFFLPPMIYQTTWFRVTCAVAIAALIWLALRYRTERVKTLLRQRMYARHAERERIARDLHDTLLQGIQALLFRLHLWETDPAIAPERRTEIAAMAVQTNAIILEGRDRVLSLRATNPPSQDLVESLTEVAGIESAGKDTRVEISTSGKQRPMLTEACRQLVDIAREAIRNAHQHAHASLVLITVDYRRSSLRLEILDDGCGIDPAALTMGERPGHFGLLGMHERAHQLRARFRVERAEARGTRITVVAPALVVFEDYRRWFRWRHTGRAGPLTSG
jgi:signal transduction histidine kinase/ligand-binding sensor domain-containing protein